MLNIPSRIPSAEEMGKLIGEALIQQINKVKDKLRGALKPVVDRADTIKKKLEPITSSLRDIASVAKGFVKTIGKGFTDKVMSSKFVKGITKVGSAFKDMAGASLNAFAMEQLMKLVEPFMKLLEPLAAIFDVLSGLLTAMIGEVLKPIMPHLQTLLEAMLKLMPVFQAIGKFVGEGLVPVFSWLSQKLVSLWNLAKIVSNLIGGAFTAGFNTIRNLFQLFVTRLQEFGTWISSIFTPIFGVMKTLWDTLVLAWANSGGKLFGPDGVIMAAFGAIFTIGKNLANSFIGGVNSAIGLINKIPGVDMATIPMLADGGMILGPTLAMIGEGGQPEMVIPLDKFEASNEAIVFELQLLRRENALLRKEQAKARIMSL